MMVPFATTCDAYRSASFNCGRRSPEYTQWPACTYCGDHVCPDHMVPGTLDEGDGERHDRCVCVLCHDEGHD